MAKDEKAIISLFYHHYSHLLIILRFSGHCNNEHLSKSLEIAELLKSLTEDPDRVSRIDAMIKKLRSINDEAQTGLADELERLFDEVTLTA